jgi:hypothetical protein
MRPHLVVLLGEVAHALLKATYILRQGITTYLLVECPMKSFHFTLCLRVPDAAKRKPNALIEQTYRQPRQAFLDKRTRIFRAPQSYFWRKVTNCSSIADDVFPGLW